MSDLKIKHLVKHKTKKEVLWRYLILILILFLYFVFISYRYGMSNGLLITALTWSFFVLCTPIADAGFLIDFPVRLLFRIRMLFSEIFVWLLAISINGFCLVFVPEVYQTNLLTKIFHQILTNPFPYWLIVILSCLGTFFSVVFGDELLDVIKHRDRKLFLRHGFIFKLVLLLAIFVGIVIVYDILIKQLGVNF